MSLHLRARTCTRAAPHHPSRWMPGLMGRPSAETELQSCRPGLPPSRSLRELDRPAHAVGAKVWEIASPSLSFSTATGLRCLRIPEHRFTHCSSTRSAERSVTDLWRRFIWVYRAGSLVICHFLLNRFLTRISTWKLEERRGRGSARGGRLGADATVVSWMALVVSSFSFTTGFPGILMAGWEFRRKWRVRMEGGGDRVGPIGILKVGVRWGVRE
jgi:hypothetical protein